MLHVNHPLLHLVNIMDPLLGNAALFSIFYNHRILTRPVEAAGLVSCKMNSNVSRAICHWQFWAHRSLPPLNRWGEISVEESTPRQTSHTIWCNVSCLRGEKS